MARRALTLIQLMAVPRYSQLRAGIGVYIILKKDQSSGKLTAGRVADILTRGDHPRGIKVRLEDGQIGRVQSLQSGSASSFLPSSSSAAAISPANTATIDPSSSLNELVFPSSGGRAAGQMNQRNFKMQDDYRNDPTPAESRSLEDYIKKPKQKKGRVKSAAAENEGAESAALDGDPGDLQKQMEEEFPQVDAALIAAIVGDHAEDVGEVRKVLSGLG